MAISKINKELLKNMLLTKQDWTNLELASELNVALNWASKNKVELCSMGFQLERKEHKEHKTHSHKGSLALNTINKYEAITFVSDLEFNHYFVVKYAINKAYNMYNLPAPYNLEGYENKSGVIKKEYFDKLDIKWNQEYTSKALCIKHLNYLLTELKQPLYNRAPKELSLFIGNLLNSLIYLDKSITNKVARDKIQQAFKEVHGTQYVPSEEQIQVIGKAELFATGIFEDIFVASIQSDAGTSKTHCAMVIQHLLFDMQPIITAITNKALDRIKNSKTVSSLLLNVANINTTKDTYQIQVLKAEQARNKIPFLLVDESSQCGLNTRRLLETVAERVLYLGDQLQLPPIKDNTGVDLIYLHTLNTQYRFLNAEDSFQRDITQLNKQQRFISLLDLFDSKVIGTITAESHTKESEDNYNTLEQKTDYTKSFGSYIDLLNNYKDDSSIVIAYAQSAVNAINHILNGGEDLKIGSKVMLSMNDYESDQFNGFQYRVTGFIGKGKALRYTCRAVETGDEYNFTKSQITLAYAITTMKCQGSSWTHVLGIDGTLKALMYLDRYVIATRAKQTVRFLSVSKIINKSKVTIQNIDNLEHIFETLRSATEGNRNNTLYLCTKQLMDSFGLEGDFQTLADIALKIGLDSQEIQDTIRSGRCVEATITPLKKTPTKSKSSSDLILSSFEINESPRTQQYFTPVFKNHKTLAGKDRTLTYEEASTYPAEILYVAEELKKSNRIVIDCDSSETVALFEKYIHLTESYISSDRDSLHLVFETDRLLPTIHKTKLDVLGNKLFSLRNIKDNKTGNGVKATVLTQEVLDVINQVA